MLVERTGARPTHDRTRGVGASSSCHSSSRAPAGIRRTKSDKTLACLRYLRGLCRGGKSNPRLRVVGRRSLHWRGRETSKRRASRILPVNIKWRHRTLREWETAICVGHLHNEHAREGKEQRRAFWDQLAMFCAGGVRICGMDANMGLFGTTPEIEEKEGWR